jgi:hypothetical protein
MEPLFTICKKLDFLVGSFPAFRPRFAGKCDRQSSDLTQFTRGYNFAVKPTTNHPRSSCSNSHLR